MQKDITIQLGGETEHGTPVVHYFSGQKLLSTAYNGMGTPTVSSIAVFAEQGDCTGEVAISPSKVGYPRFVQFTPDKITVSPALAREIAFAYRVSSVAEDVYGCLFEDKNYVPDYPITDYEEEDLWKAADHAGGEDVLCKRIAEHADEEWDSNVSYWENISNCADSVIGSFLD